MTETHTPHIPTMDEVYRWMESNQLTATDMLAEIKATRQLKKDFPETNLDDGREQFCSLMTYR